MKVSWAATAIFLWSAFGASAQIFPSPLVGGPGGGPFQDTCRPGDVMVGYNVTSGKGMNTFAAVCQAQNNGVLVGANYGLRTWGKDDRSGGPYHGFETPRCPAGSALTELHVWVNNFNELDSVAGGCRPMRAGPGMSSSLPRTQAAGGAARNDGFSTCHKGTIAVGVQGRSGSLVDSVGLVCAAFPWYGR